MRRNFIFVGSSDYESKSVLLIRRARFPPTEIYRFASTPDTFSAGEGYSRRSFDNRNTIYTNQKGLNQKNQSRCFLDINIRAYGFICVVVIF